MLKLIDTYIDFLIFYNKTKFENLNQKISEFQLLYMSKYPELFNREISEYKKYNINPISMLERYLLELDYYLVYIEEARENILSLSNRILNRAMKEFKMDFDVLFVIYVGIGLAAGWATK